MLIYLCLYQLYTLTPNSSYLLSSSSSFFLLFLFSFLRIALFVCVTALRCCPIAIHQRYRSHLPLHKPSMSRHTSTRRDACVCTCAHAATSVRCRSNTRFHSSEADSCLSLSRRSRSTPLTALIDRHTLSTSCSAHLLPLSLSSPLLSSLLFPSLPFPSPCLCWVSVPPPSPPLLTTISPPSPPPPAHPPDTHTHTNSKMRVRYGMQEER